MKVCQKCRFLQFLVVSKHNKSHANSTVSTEVVSELVPKKSLFQIETVKYLRARNSSEFHFT